MPLTALQPRANGVGRTALTMTLWPRRCEGGSLRFCLKQNLQQVKVYAAEEGEVYGEATQVAARCGSVLAHRVGER